MNPRNVILYIVALCIILGLCAVVSCSVTVRGGGSTADGFAIGGRTFVIELAGFELFTIQAGGPPVQQAVGATLFDQTPTDVPASGAVSLSSTHVQARAIGAGKDRIAMQAVSGAAQIKVMIDDALSSEPCASGVEIGSFNLSLTNGEVAVAPSSIDLPAIALQYAMTGQMTVCFEATADIDVELTIDQIGVEFGPASGSNGTGGENGNTDAADSPSDVPDGINDGDLPADADQDADFPAGVDDDAGDTDDPGSVDPTDDPDADTNPDLDGDGGGDSGVDGEGDDDTVPGSLISFPIEYTESLHLIVNESDVDDWSSEADRAISEVAVSADGTTVAFNVSICGSIATDPNCWHVYVADSDGTMLTDLTPDLPDEALGGNHFLRLSDDGTRLFLRGPRFGDVHDVYMCDTAGGGCVVAVENIVGSGGHKPYEINGEGTRVFFKHNAGWDEAAQKTQQGLYYADIGGQPVQIMHWDALPPTGATPINVLSLAGVSTDGQTLLFQWNHGEWFGDHFGGDLAGMWHVGLGSAPQMSPADTHTHVFAIQDMPNRIIDADGSHALYLWHQDGENTLDVVELATGAKSTLVEGGSFGFLALSPDGSVARYQGSGAILSHIDVATGQQRDALCQHCDMSHDMWPTRVSDITTDNSRFFLASQSRLYRADVGSSNLPTGDGPRIDVISFGADSLPVDDVTSTIIEVSVSDPQGIGDIEWVRWRYLIDGVESPSWLSGDPLWANTWDLFDDGTRSDRVAGDGVFALDGLKSETSGNFWERFPPPTAIGVRVVAKDVDGNYAIADTTMPLDAE